jgi:hypothetical protein
MDVDASDSTLSHASWCSEFQCHRAT